MTDIDPEQTYTVGWAAKTVHPFYNAANGAIKFVWIYDKIIMYGQIYLH